MGFPPQGAGAPPAVPQLPFSTSNLIEVGVGETSYTKKREMKFTITPASKVCGVFTMKHGYAGYTIYGRIYKNGSPLGTERANSTTSYITYYEEFTDQFSVNDLIQLYMYVSGSTGTLKDYTVSSGLVITL